jgi:hypothetical protein
MNKKTFSKKAMTILYPDGTQKIVKPKGELFTLKQLQDAVTMKDYGEDNLIEIAPVSLKGFIVFVNEEGLLRLMPPNKFAQEYLGELFVGPVAIVPEQFIE